MRALAVGIVTLAVLASALPALLSQDSSVLADTRSVAHLHIDANPTNGSGPCTVIDETHSVAIGVPYSVGLCNGRMMRSTS